MPIRHLIRFPTHRFLLSFLLWAGVPTHSAAELFVPVMLPDNGYTETFSVSADMEQGGFAQIQLGVTNMGPGSGRAICRVLLVSAQDSWRSQEIVSPGEWRTRPAKDDRLAIGGCTVHDADRSTITATTEEGAIEIVFGQVIAPRAGYKTQAKNGTFSVTPLTAGARAKVTVRPRSGAVRQHAATVYIQHDLGTVSPDQVGQQWFRFRTSDGEPVRYGFAHRRGKGNAGSGQFASGVSAAVDFTGLTIEAPQVPGTGLVILASNEQTITLRPVRTIAAYAPLREMGLVGRVLSAIVGDPLLSILEVTWEEGAGRRKAILEVTTFR